MIRHIETYDVTTIRASTPMFLLARRIKAMGVKMVLSGEGSDEIFGGYLYFHKAPNAREFHEELVRKLDALHNYDCLRANKSMMAWGVEPRVPFLDVEFLMWRCGWMHGTRWPEGAHRESGAARGVRRLSAGVDPVAAEGAVQRWRRLWLDRWLEAHAEARVSDRELAAADKRFPLNPPVSKEAYFYRMLFEQAFPGPAVRKPCRVASPSPVRRQRRSPGTPASPAQPIPRAGRWPGCIRRHWGEVAVILVRAGHDICAKSWVLRQLAITIGQPSLPEDPG